MYLLEMAVSFSSDILSEVGLRDRMVALSLSV